MVGWGWRGTSRKLVVVNLGDGPAEGNVSLPWDDLRGRTWLLTRPAAGHTSGAATISATMYVALPPWGFHLFDLAPADPGQE